MEANKIKGEAKSIVLDNGAELTYCERGEENQEVIISTAFYFHTLMPVLELLAEKYHVYGIVMRFDGPTDELNADGTTNWSRQWGKDEYDFAVKMGIREYIHFGKCHGTVPGWYQVKEHPEMLKAFASFYLAPHVFPADDNSWFSLMEGGNPQKMMVAALRKPEEGVAKKMEELQALGPVVLSPEIEAYGASAERIWDSAEDVKDALHNNSIPVGFCFGSEDPVFADYCSSNIYAIMNTRASRTTFLQGEKHLMELDCPERVAEEVFIFLNEVEKGFHKEIMEKPAQENMIGQLK